MSIYVVILVGFLSICFSFIYPYFRPVPTYAGFNLKILKYSLTIDLLVFLFITFRPLVELVIRKKVTGYTQV